MHWADYRKGSRKAKVHLGLDLNRSIPRKMFLSDGKGAERPFAAMILSPGQTGVWIEDIKATIYLTCGKKRKNILYAALKPVKRKASLKF